MKYPICRLIITKFVLKNLCVDSDGSPELSQESWLILDTDWSFCSFCWLLSLLNMRLGLWGFSKEGRRGQTWTVMGRNLQIFDKLNIDATGDTTMATQSVTRCWVYVWWLAWSQQNKTTHLIIGDCKTPPPPARYQKDSTHLSMSPKKELNASVEVMKAHFRGF